MIYFLNQGKIAWDIKKPDFEDIDMKDPMAY